MPSVESPARFTTTLRLAGSLSRPLVRRGASLASQAVSLIFEFDVELLAELKLPPTLGFTNLSDVDVCVSPDFFTGDGALPHCNLTVSSARPGNATASDKIAAATRTAPEPPAEPGAANLAAPLLVA